MAQEGLGSAGKATVCFELPISKIEYGILFIIVNSLLGIFELFQFKSMNLSQYFGNVEQFPSFYGLRFLLMGLLFIPGFNIINCYIYSL